MKCIKILAGISALALATPLSALAGTVLIPEGGANDVLIVDTDTGRAKGRI